MVTVTLTSQRVREVHFVNHVDKPGQIQLGGSFNFHVQFAKNNSVCVATLYQSAQMKDDPEKLFLSGEIVGTFSLTGVVDEEGKRDAHLACYDQLFPYLQSAMAQLAVSAGMPGFMLKKNQMKRENINFSAPQKKPEEPMHLPIV